MGLNGFKRNEHGALLFYIIRRIDGVGSLIKSLKEPWLDNTASPHGYLLLTFFSDISEFERDLFRLRPLEGMAAARARGVQILCDKDCLNGLVYGKEMMVRHCWAINTNASIL